MSSTRPVIRCFSPWAVVWRGFVATRRLEEALTIRAQNYALTAHRALQLWGYSRTDMIVSGNDIYVLETNTIPGMTPTSLLPQGAAAAGLDFSELLDRLIELALE